MNRSALIRQGGDRRPPMAPEDLLRRERTQGFPLDYVLARIRGRRSGLIRDWTGMVHDLSPAEYLASAQYRGFVRERTPEGMWRALLQEHRWVRGQMDEGTRRAFAPYFLYAELRTVFICLRHLERSKVESAGELIGASLLSGAARSALGQGGARDAVETLELLFGALSQRFAGLSAAYDEKGLRGVERALTQGYLAAVLELPLPAVLRELFRRIIDSRNILALLKAFRSGGEGTGLFLDGGTIPAGRFLSLLAKDDMRPISGLVRQAAGVTIASPDPTQVEVALYRGITRYLRTEGRDPLEAALILDYLWRCQVEVMNLSMLMATRGLERSEAAAELVR